jgi:hypothetical protein
MAMVNIDVFEAFEKQHRSKLLEAAQSSRDLQKNLKWTVSDQKKLKTTFPWLRILVNPLRWKKGRKIKIRLA